MKQFTKKTIVYRTLAVMLTFLVSVGSVTACTIGNNDHISDERGHMNIDFGADGMIRNGTEYYTYPVEVGQKGVVSISITRKSGRIDMDIYPTDRKDEPEYTGRELDSASFSVILTEPGEYQVRITAKEFVGDYGISWKTEDNTAA